MPGVAGSSQGSQRQLGVDRAGDGGADDLARPHIEDDGRVDPAGLDADVSDVGPYSAGLVCRRRRPGQGRETQAHRARCRRSERTAGCAGRSGPPLEENLPLQRQLLDHLFQDGDTPHLILLALRRRRPFGPIHRSSIASPSALPQQRRAPLVPQVQLRLARKAVHVLLDDLALELVCVHLSRSLYGLPPQAPSERQSSTSQPSSPRGSLHRARGGVVYEPVCDTLRRPLDSAYHVADHSTRRRFEESCGGASSISFTP